jgi:hypothetical protein
VDATEQECLEKFVLDNEEGNRKVKVKEEVKNQRLYAIASVQNGR